MRIIFKDGQIIEGSAKFETPMICTIQSDMLPNLSGFQTENQGVILGDFSNFTTLYRQLEGSYQLSGDGSHYEPPEPPEPPIPVHTTLIADGEEYDVIDFSGTSFRIEGDLTEIQEIFEDIEEYEADGVLYEHLVFQSVSQSEDYILVQFYQKSDIEVRVDELEISQEFQNDAIDFLLLQ